MKKVAVVMGSDSDLNTMRPCIERLRAFRIPYTVRILSAHRTPAEAAAFTLLQDQLNEVLQTLTDREQKVLRLRFGLDDGRARTLEEVGKEFNVTRERIRQIEAKALRKLRHPSRSRKLKDYLD